jgi:hypothetical protein
MAREKKPPTEANPEHEAPIKPMPFPGESPTVSLAMAAAQMYGLHEGGKPTRSSAKPKASATKKPARAAGKPRKPTRTAKSKKAAGAAKGGAKRKRPAAHA